ncbi:glycylpeptide N-tetradecanoyltransferase [Enteropsectra breve]|nr:glycylpeptide N-tetradecanoyltransferase [Enteropsectra breve]
MKKPFWSTQPVGNRSCSSNSSAGEITLLPSGFDWSNNMPVEQITAFLSENYYNGSNSTFRFNYSQEFFEYLFKDLTHKSEFSLSLIAPDKKQAGYVLAKVHQLSLRGAIESIVSINFLCVEKQYRRQNFAPLLIEEIRRIANVHGIYKAIFTGTKDYGFSFTTAVYYHFPLCFKTLIKAGFLDTDDAARYSFPKCTKRKDTKMASCGALQKIYSKYISDAKKFQIHESFTKDSFVDMLVPSKNIIETIVNEETNEMASVYIIDSINIESGESARIAYLYYWCGSNKIIEDLIAHCYENGIAMLNALNLAANCSIIDKYGMIEGDGSLDYHFFNISQEKLPGTNLNFILF